MAIPKPAVKLAGLRPRSDSNVKSMAPPPVGADQILPAVKADLYQEIPYTRIPVGQAKGPSVSMPAPPASFSINNTPGKPQRSPRGNQYS